MNYEKMSEKLQQILMRAVEICKSYGHASVDTIQLLKAIFETLSPDRKPHKEKVMDFRQDWALIYAGFRQAYGIDLFAEQDMHWMQFTALLQGLPNSTMLSKVMEIRAMKVPAKASPEYRARIAQLKAEYALKTSTPVQSGLMALFKSLESIAERR